MTNVLILGSAPEVVAARGWPRAPFDVIIAINNAWRVRPDWDVQIHPHDFAPDRLPPAASGRIVTDKDFVPAQNAFGGFVYAGATMMFTTGYWALNEYKPSTLAFFGCNMVYAPSGNTHFYGTGSPDPLRADPTLQSLEAKSARLQVLAAMQGCATVNLSAAASRLVFPRAAAAEVARARPAPYDAAQARAALAQEAALGYLVPSGRYWEELARFDPVELRALDARWLAAAAPTA